MTRTATAGGREPAEARAHTNRPENRTIDDQPPHSRVIEKQEKDP